MSRSPGRLAGTLGLLCGVVIALGSCGGPSLPALTDPVEIVTAGLRSTESARTVHLDVKVDGSISVDLTGGAGTATTFPLTGTIAAADVDMAGGRARATFTVPALFNLTGELIQIGETSYVKTSLNGPLFETMDAIDSLPVDPTDVSGIFDDVGDLLLADGMDPVKGDDVDCGGKPCYTVTIELTPDELMPLGLTAPAIGDLPIELGPASLVLTIRVEKETYRLAGIEAVLSFGDVGSATVELNLSNWDEPMDISPPPADQVKPAA